MTEIYLGKPPAKIEAWISAHYEPTPQQSLIDGTLTDGGSTLTLKLIGKANDGTMQSEDESIKLKFKKLIAEDTGKVLWMSTDPTKKLALYDNMDEFYGTDERYAGICVYDQSHTNAEFINDFANIVDQSSVYWFNLTWEEEWYMLPMSEGGAFDRELIGIYSSIEAEIGLDFSEWPSYVFKCEGEEQVD